MALLSSALKSMLTEYKLYPYMNKIINNKQHLEIISYTGNNFNCSRDSLFFYCIYRL